MTTTPSSPPAVGGDARTYAAATAEFGEFLTAWVDDGLAAAGRRYLVPDQRVSSANPSTAPALRQGRVLGYQRYRWSSDRDFTLLVTFDLTFRGRNDSAYGEGRNSRFVTFTRQTDRGGWLMSLATGP